MAALQKMDLAGAKIWFDIVKQAQQQRQWMPGVFGQKQAAHYTRGVVLWQRLLLHNFR
jgi:hypothetical protein